jgi:ribA/ribD-fused uncharacterized protein
MQTTPLASDRRVLFFARDRAQFGFLSHFHPAPIELDGVLWPTVEHYYQAQKSFDPAYRAAILAAAKPGRAKRLAAPRRMLRNGYAPQLDWGVVKLDIMRRADTAKFIQHADLAERLLATDGAEIVEDSPYDPFWGAGLDGNGFNWAGRILMEVRSALRF